MRAAVLFELQRPLEIVNDIEIPDLKRGQVLVKLACSGVCRSQLMEISGGRGEDKYLPHLLGHEGSGIVIETGEDVLKVKAGDRVILGWIKGSGIEAGGVKYKKGDTTINAGAITTFNEYAVVSENRCVIMEEGIPFDIAVLFGCAIPTGAGMITNEIDLKKGDSIAIFGLGGVGLSALMATQLYNCKNVIAVDVDNSKLELAKEFGASAVIDSSEKNPVEAIMELSEGRGVDFSIDAAGEVSTIEQAFQSVRVRGGLCVFASHPESGKKISIEPHDLISGKQLRGSWGGSCDPDRDLPKFMDLYRKGKLPLEKLISSRYSLDEINNAVMDLNNKKIVRAVIEIDKRA